MCAVRAATRLTPTCGAWAQHVTPGPCLQRGPGAVLQSKELLVEPRGTGGRQRGRQRAGLVPGRSVGSGTAAGHHLPVLCNRKTTSDLGWAFIGLIDAGRLKEYTDDGADSTRIYRHQLAACTYEVLPGPGKLLRWSVPASRGHDGLLSSTALTARLDALDWRDRTARGSGS
ncbi:MAG: hypothetical protein K0Q71_4402 [Thermomicrobiales bacterium]|nr:hypothetical protein [Thermomicrobiales bacterium]